MEATLRIYVNGILDYELIDNKYTCQAFLHEMTGEYRPIPLEGMMILESEIQGDKIKITTELNK